MPSVFRQRNEPRIKTDWLLYYRSVVVTYCNMTPDSCNLPISWAGLRWARSRGNTKGAASGRRTVGTRFHSNEYDWRSNALRTRSRWFLGNAHRNVSVHTATNLQIKITAKNAVTPLLKEMIPILFDQNLPQGENWPTDDRRQIVARRSYRTEVKSLFYVVSLQ
jgi:hypothetical protein